MKKISTVVFALLVASVMAVGCAKKAPPPADPAPPAAEPATEGGGGDAYGGGAGYGEAAPAAE